MYLATVLLTWSYCLNASLRLAVNNMVTQVLFLKTRNINEKVVCLFSEHSVKGGCIHSIFPRNMNALLVQIEDLCSTFRQRACILYTLMYMPPHHQLTAYGTCMIALAKATKAGTRDAEKAWRGG